MNGHGRFQQVQQDLDQAIQTFRSVESRAAKLSDMERQDLQSAIYRLCSISSELTWLSQRFDADLEFAANARKALALARGFLK